MKKYIKPAINVESYRLATHLMDVSIDIDTDDDYTVPGTSAWSKRQKDIIIEEEDEQGGFGW